MQDSEGNGPLLLKKPSGLSKNSENPGCYSYLSASMGFSLAALIAG
jgi:hypothetical protein